MDDIYQMVDEILQIVDELQPEFRAPESKCRNRNRPGFDPTLFSVSCELVLNMALAPS